MGIDCFANNSSFNSLTFSDPDSTSASYADYIGFPGYDPNNPSLYPGYTFKDSAEAISAYGGAYNPVNNSAVANSLAMRVDKSAIASLSNKEATFTKQLYSIDRQSGTLKKEIKYKEKAYKSHPTNELRAQLKSLKRSKKKLLKNKVKLTQKNMHNLSEISNYTSNLQMDKQYQPQYEETELHTE